MKINFRQIWFTPTISSLLRGRLESFLLVLFGILQVGLTYAHLPGWVCPIKAVTGIPCPGCGLSGASSELLHGHWLESLKIHAFAPFFMAGMGFMIVILILPVSLRSQIIDHVAQFERKTGVTAWFLTCFILYWGLRIFNIL